ncbi:MAG TPA: hypothetical protein VEA35_00620 [Ramlibacter sp.]|nr:hypothetical protein [Ramlibacter sp.]
MTRNSTELEPWKMAEELAQRGMAWADANAAAEALEETRQSVYSQIATGFLEAGDSAAKAELRAKADERYQTHIKSMVDARRTANRAHVRWKTYQAFVELVRSAESSRRAEMNLAR